MPSPSPNDTDIRAVSVPVSTSPAHGGRAGSIPSTALRLLRVTPIPVGITKRLLVREHYLHSLPGGTSIACGVFLHHRLMGALTLGVGPLNAHRLVDGATPGDCLVLTRFWLSDELPSNSESRVLGIVLRALRRNTGVKFIVSYADPSRGHLGVIYQASGWLYTGRSSAMPLYDLGDGKLRHSRTPSHAFGTHSVRHFKKHGLSVRVVPQLPKHRYIVFLDASWQSRLRGPSLPYPKGEVSDAYC